MKKESAKFQFEKEIAWETPDKGVKRQIMAYNDNIMMVKVKFEKGAAGSVHSHPHGSTYYAATEYNIPVARATRFEDGDARFAARWKIKTVGTDTYYAGTTRGYFNYGGITTTEMYLIKAECLARNNDLQGAMDALNAVRKTRILPAKYQDLAATSIQDAVKKIWKTKENELIFSIIPFADARRLNLDSNYARTFTKTINGTTYTLTPTSHLWTMPFPMGATSNPGNGTLTQNVDK